MVGFLDSKGIRSLRGTTSVRAWVASTNALGEPAALTPSSNGDLVATPTHLSATTAVALPGRWGIADAAVTATYGGFTVGGFTALTAGETATSGYWVLAISANGSVIASAAVASTTALVTGLGLYSSSLGGMIIY